MQSRNPIQTKAESHVWQEIFFDANPNSKNGPSEPAPKFGKKQQSVY